MIETDNLYNMDCIEGMKLMADGSVDAVIADLPYGVLNRRNGSGTTAVAAIRTERHYIGFEIEPAYCEIAGQRIQEELKRRNGTKEGYREINNGNQ